METVKYKTTNSKKWKFVLTEPIAITTPKVDYGHWKAYGRGLNSKGKLLIEADGNKLTIYDGYAWDGCTCAVDADWNIRASLFHDALYQAKKCGAETASWGNIDGLFGRLMAIDGAPCAAQLVYYTAVRTAGALWKLGTNNSLIIESTK